MSENRCYLPFIVHPSVFQYNRPRAAGETARGCTDTPRAGTLALDSDERGS
jgi:hypothetical protein